MTVILAVVMYFERFNDNSRMQRAVCLVLCFVAWRGPVPMLHDHESMTSPEMRERHEQTFHLPESCDECFGLHWHFAFPEDVNERPLQNSSEVAPELAMFACAMASQCMESSHLEEMLDSLPRMSEAMSALMSAERWPSEQLRLQPTTFLASLLCDVPLIAVTGVCLL